MDLYGIEKRIARLENRIENIDAAFNTFRDVLIKIQNENVQLRKNRDFLLQKHKEMVKKSINKEKLSQDIKEKLVEPLQKEINEDVYLIRKLTKQEDVETDSRLDDLFTLVMDSGNITIKDAAVHFGVHELQIEEWAQTLEDHGLIDIVKKGTTTELRKIVYR
jgi:sugar-specific transcriptional regulator TrmB